MKYMSTNEIREKFLFFFNDRGHKIYPSFPLIPDQDPSLLLINSGMAPLKDFFTAKKTIINKEIVSSQKCIRTQDIKNIGKTLRHSTFFEMLGNFSFGSYFKNQAIKLAWEFITQVLKIPKEKLFISVYNQDNETYNIWINDIKIKKTQIFKLGNKDNFWEIGPGPCGPSTEIYYDNGIEYGCNKKNCMIGCNCNRYVEFWNLVFSQFNSDGKGNYTDLIQKNIDTGMGLERVSAIMQNVKSIFDIDINKNIISDIENIINKKYNQNNTVDLSIRIICDHIKSIVMMISDDILPTHDGRGYVLKRLIRRSLYHGYILGVKKHFLHKIAPSVFREYSNIYTNLKTKFNNIINIIKIEEEKFEKTLILGKKVVNKKILEMKKNKISNIDYNELLHIYDTYGLPMEISEEIFKRENFKINNNYKINNDYEENHILIKKTNNNSFKNLKLLDLNLNCEYVRNNNLLLKTNIIKILNEKYDYIDCAEKNDNIMIITEKTPFYAESGGQKSDIGFFKNDNCIIEIQNVIMYNEKICMHIGKVLSGTVKIKQEFNLIVNKNYHFGIMRSHTTAHLLHQTLRKIYGEELQQAGLSIDSDHFRFDITYDHIFSNDEIQNIENRINNIILTNLRVNNEIVDTNQAILNGAIALFKNKYLNKVQVIKIGNYSKEICKGSHVQSTSQIYVCKIISVTSVANCVKRFYLLTGKKALDYLQNNNKTLNLISKMYNTNNETIINKLINYNNELLNLTSKYNELINNFSVSILKNVKYKDLNNTKIYIEIKNNISNDIFDKMISIVKKNKIIDSFLILINRDYNDNKFSKIFIYCNPILLSSNKLFDAKIIFNKIFTKYYKGKGGGNSLTAIGITECKKIEYNSIFENLKEFFYDE